MKPWGASRFGPHDLMLPEKRADLADDAGTVHVAGEEQVAFGSHVDVELVDILDAQVAAAVSLARAWLTR